MSKDVETNVRIADDQPMTKTIANPELDFERVGAFAERLAAGYTAGMVTLMIDVGHRTGLFEALAGAGPTTSDGLAARAECDERYVREWLGAVTTAGIVEHDADALTYWLPAEHAVCLTGQSSMNLATTAAFQAHLG